MYDPSCLMQFVSQLRTQQWKKSMMSNHRFFESGNNHARVYENQIANHTSRHQIILSGFTLKS